MANTRVILRPADASFPATNFPQLIKVNDIFALAFDASTKETAYFVFVAWQGLTGTLHAKIFYKMASATSGDVDVNVAIEAVTPGDTLNTNTTHSFDSVNAADNNNVPGTAGYVQMIDVTLTNADSIAAGDLVTVSVDRDAADDTATGDMHIVAIEITDGN